MFTNEELAALPQPAVPGHPTPREVVDALLQCFGNQLGCGTFSVMPLLVKCNEYSDTLKKHSDDKWEKKMATPPAEIRDWFGQVKDYLIGDDEEDVPSDVTPTKKTTAHGKQGSKKKSHTTAMAGKDIDGNGTSTAGPSVVKMVKAPRKSSMAIQPSIGPEDMPAMQSTTQPVIDLDGVQVIASGKETDPSQTIPHASIFGATTIGKSSGSTNPKVDKPAEASPKDQVGKPSGSTNPKVDKPAHASPKDQVGKSSGSTNPKVDKPAHASPSAQVGDSRVPLSDAESSKMSHSEIVQAAATPKASTGVAVPSTAETKATTASSVRPAVSEFTGTPAKDTPMTTNQGNPATPQRKISHVATAVSPAGGSAGSATSMGDFAHGYRSVDPNSPATYPRGYFDPQVNQSPPGVAHDGKTGLKRAADSSPSVGTAKKAKKDVAQDITSKLKDKMLALKQFACDLHAFTDMAMEEAKFPFKHVATGKFWKLSTQLDRHKRDVDSLLAEYTSDVLHQH